MSYRRGVDDEAGCALVLAAAAAARRGLPRALGWDAASVVTACSFSVRGGGSSSAGAAAVGGAGVVPSDAGGVATLPEACVAASVTGGWVDSGAGSAAGAGAGPRKWTSANTPPARSAAPTIAAILGACARSSRPRSGPPR